MSCFSLSASKGYDACYEWRKVVLRSALWAELPPEIIEKIAKECITALYQPSGTLNWSRIDEVRFPWSQQQPAGTLNWSRIDEVRFWSRIEEPT